MRGATVKELHQSWQYSDSFHHILTRFWALDLIALAALAAKVTILDSFLFQNAASSYVAHDPARNVTLLGVAATNFPQTGYVVADGSFMISDQYTPTVNTFETSNGFFRDVVNNFHGCDGICYSWVDAAGFEIDCQKSTDHTEFARAALSAYNAQNGGGNAAAWTDLAIFNSSFHMATPDSTTNYTRLIMELSYFDSDDPNNPNPSTCPGTVTSVQCSLRPALVRYPTTIVNYTDAHVTNGISVGGRPHGDENTNAPPTPDYSYANKQAEGFEILSYLDLGDQNVMNSTTQLGGVVAALSQFLSSTATITYTGTGGWILGQEGTMAQTMMFGPPNMGTCDCSFKDGLSSLVESVNQLAFLTATNQTMIVNNATAGSRATVVGITDNTTATYTDLPNSLEIRDAIYYKTEWKWMYGGIGSTVLALLLVIPAYWHYGNLGQKKTLGPMEVASAFNAPMLETGEHAEHPKDLEDLIEKVGDRKVQYGVMEDQPQYASPASPAIAHTPASPTPTSPNLNNRNSVRLGMAEPARVRPVSGAWSTPTSPTIPTSPAVASPPTSPRIAAPSRNDEIQKI